MSKAEASIENIYRLEGRVPVAKAIPFGLQHILAMFVANIAPIIIVAAACGLSASESAGLGRAEMQRRKRHPVRLPVTVLSAHYRRYLAVCRSLHLARMSAWLP